MLTLLAPYILGLLTQLGSLLGQYAATPQRGVLGAPAGVARDEFALRLDRAQVVPSALVLCTSGLLIAPEMGKAATAIVVAGAVVTSFVLFIWLQDRDPVQYGDLTRKLFGLSIVNVIMIAANVSFGAVVYLTYEDPPSPDSRATHAGAGSAGG